MNDTNEEENVHDQLPTLQEIHAKSTNDLEKVGSHADKERKRRKLCFIVFALLVILGAASAPIILAVRRNTRNRDALNFLAGISSSHDLQEAGSSQQLASEWIIKDDKLQVEIPKSMEDKNADKFVTRYVLAVLYYALNGPTWTDGSIFLSGTDICFWNRANDQVLLGVWCDMQYQPEAIFIPDNNLVGSLPTEIGFLASLKWIDMSVNKINGPLPESLGLLASLQGIAMSYNRLNGPLPYWLGKLPDLQILRLSNNKFSSSIPDSFSNASKLIHLFLDDNDLNGNLSVIESLTNLEALLVEDNNFEQTLDSSFLASLDKLQIIDASNNLLKGQLPSHLFQMNELQVLDLHANELVGNLPDFPDNTKLDFLALHENIFDGVIPESIANLKNLTHLDLSTNAFSGPIPSSIGNMVLLTYLFVAMNNFDEGVIPDFLQKLTKLKELSFKGTSRSGPIPDWIGNLSNLILLDLDQNKLTGEIPPSMSNLTQLVFLLLNRNELTGSLPGEMHSIGQLKMLLLDENNITALGQVENQYQFCDKTPYLGKYGSVFTADCAEPNRELECTCCTECCGNGTLCNNGDDFLANNDLIWEHGYDRQNWMFNNETAYYIRRVN